MIGTMLKGVIENRIIVIPNDKEIPKEVLDLQKAERL